MTIKLTVLTVAAALTAQTTLAGSLPSEHAPIGVMADHNHLAGEWMTSYRYGRMNMKNIMLDGDYLNGAMMAPKTMKREMHMVGMMYGVTNKLTIVGSVPLVKTKMTMGRAMGDDFTTSSSGVGDVMLGGLYTLYQKESSKVIFNLGLSLPTGSIDKTDDTPMMSNQLLLPVMQPGTGTYDIMSRVTYTDRHDQWGWGAQLGTVIRTGTNDNNVKTGDRGSISAWVSRDLANYVSLSLRLDGQKWGDTTLNGTPIMNLMRAERIDALAGINFIIPDGPLKGNRFAVEMGKPIHQNLGLNRMENDYRVHAGWQLAF